MEAFHVSAVLFTNGLDKTVISTGQQDLRGDDEAD